MNTGRLLASAVLALWMAASASADAVITYNGQRLEGQLIGETEDEVWLRQSRPDGITFILKIHRFDIARVERGGPSGSQPASAPTEGEKEASPVQPDADKLKQLDLVISKYHEENFHWAGFLVTQLISKSSPGELAYMSAEVQKRLGISLAELAANSHFKAAEPAKPGDRIRLPYVTHYERPALLRLLARAHEEALGQLIAENNPTAIATETRRKEDQQPKAQDPQSVTVDQIPHDTSEAKGSTASSGAQSQSTAIGPRPAEPTAPIEKTARTAKPANRVSHAGGGVSSLRPTSAPAPSHVFARGPSSRPSPWPAQRPATAIDWLDRPEEYDGTPAEAEAMVKHVQYTISLLSERIRLETKARTDPALRTALIQEKDRLGLLLKAAKALTKGNLTQKQRAAILAERKRLEESHRKEVVPRELLIEEFVRQGRKDGPPPGKYPTTCASGNVELVPVDVNTP
jgi:hypothetical protein